MEQMDISQGSEIDLANDIATSENDLTNDSANDTMNKDESLNTSKKLVKKDIENLILQNSIRISTSIPSKSSKSDVWKRFKRIVVDNIPQDFAICDTCKCLYTHTPKSGTKSLNRHICHSPTGSNKRGPAKPLTDTKSDSIQTYFLKNVPPYAKAALNKDIAFGLAKDLRSLRTVEGTGFKHMAQSLINFGATYGRQQIENNIQHRTTLRDRYIPEMCSETREKYKEILNRMPRNHKFAFSKDLWSEKYQKRVFLSLTLHFIKKNVFI